MDNASKLEGDPFRPSPVVEDVDKGPRQMLEVFLKSAPFLKVRLSTALASRHRAGHGCGRVLAFPCAHLIFRDVSDCYDKIKTRRTLHQYSNMMLLHATKLPFQWDVFQPLHYIFFFDNWDGL